MIAHPIPYEDLITYAAGELIGDESAVIERHLIVCVECEATVSRFRNIGMLLRTDAGEIPPASTVARAHKLFIQHKRTQQLRRIESGLFSLFQTSKLSPATALLVLLIANLLLYVGIGAMMGQNAVPGDFLYPLKTGLEDLRVTATLRDSDKVKLQLDLAGTRLEELQNQTSQQRFQNIPDTAIAYEAHVQRSSDSLSTVLSKDLIQAKSLAQVMKNTLNQYIDSLTTLNQSVPEDIKPVLQHAIMISGSAVSVALRVLNMPAIIAQPTATPRSPGLGAPTLVSTPLPIPSNTRVWPDAQAVPPVGTSVPGKLPLPATVRPPPGKTLSVPVKRCPSSAQPKPSGIIKSVTMAEGVRNPEGEPINPKEEFKPTGAVHAIVRIQNAPANTKFQGLWCVTDVGSSQLTDTQIGEAEILMGQTGYMDFSLTPSQRWATGTYRLEIFVNGVLDTVRQFRVK